ncbi:MAG: MBL fold metallo-hydrolase [Candidatus Erginobacter occultus]|nr:MBL fold metallo-hydrolase [Candidatus Erginobacter occultus]
MLEVKQFPYGKDNLGYLVHGEKEAAAIDPGETGPVLDYLREKGLVLKEIRNTHSHGDHTGGNRPLAAAAGVGVVGFRDAGFFQLEGERIEVIPTPGHTADSVAFFGPGWLISGDTIFIANAGNCPPERLEIFRQSLDRLLTLPEETVLYPGHDYTARSLRRAEEIDPGNPDREKFQRDYNPPPVASTIGVEKRINPYLRTDCPAVIAYLKRAGKPAATSAERFRSFMMGD